MWVCAATVKIDIFDFYTSFDLKESWRNIYFFLLRCSVLEAMNRGLKLIRDAVENAAVDCSAEAAVQN